VRLGTDGLRICGAAELRSEKNTGDVRKEQENPKSLHMFKSLRISAAPDLRICGAISFAVHQSQSSKNIQEGKE
jgi:hypothetical protein